jgi:hypothetical protein
MTGRFPIRSGTYQVPRGGVPEGLTTWEITLPQLLSAQGYATGIWGKWHLGSAEARLPTNRGFDEWYGIPRTYSEVFWPSLNDTHSLWPSVGQKQGWDPSLVPAEPIYEARKGEKPRKVGGAGIPQDRPIDGVDQMDFCLGKQERSNREGFPAYVADRLQAVKWRNWKMHLIWQENMYDAPQKLPLPKIINLLTDLKEEHDVLIDDGWVTYPMMKIVNDFEESLRKSPPIKMGTPDPYHPPN